VEEASDVSVEMASLNMETIESSEKSEVLVYEDVSKSFRTGRLEREQQMVQFSAARYCCVAI
jgi:hypothetical protein